MNNRIYHYTDANALLEIIKTRKLWSTDIGYMNDKREGDIPNKYLTQFSGSQNLYSEIKTTDYIKSFIEHFMSSHEHNYITSFSKRYDNLSLYRTYGPPDGGYCIGFEIGYLKNISQHSLIECDYSAKSQKTEVQNLLRKLLDEAEKLRILGHTAQEAANHLKQSTDYVSVFSKLAVKQKSPEFITEEEVRLINHAWVSRKLRVSSRGNLLIPYVEVELPNTNTDVLITLGPNSNADLARKSMQDLGNLAKNYGTKWNIQLGVWELSGFRNI